MPGTPGPLGRLLRYARGRRRQIWAATWCSIGNKFFDLAPPVLIGAAVDVVVQREGSFIGKLGIVDLRSQLWLLAIATVIIWGLESLFEYAYGVLWRNLAQTLQHDMRVDAYDHVQKLEMGYFEDESTGGLMSVLNDDINQLERFLDHGANDILQVTTTVVVVSAVFFYLAPQVAWMALAPMPFILVGSFWYQRTLTPRYAGVRERVGLLNSRLAGNLGGMATIKSFTAEDYETTRVAEDSDAYRQSNRKAIRLSSAFSPLIRIVIVVGFTCTLVFGGFAVLDGVLAVGAFTVMVYLTQRLLWPLTRLGQTFDLYQRAMASTQRVLDLLDKKPTVISGTEELATSEVRGEIRFHDVSFAYKKGFPVIENLNLEIPAGETTAVVGSTGSGKTTLVKLMLRFYDVNSGSITLDGHDVRDLTFDSLRGAIGLVSQDVFLFHGTVRENIAYGRRDASEEEVQHAAEVAEAHEFITQLPEGYDTIVGERGQKLSGGQRQRLSIARAVLKNPPILILDEATSSVDNETEAAIQRSMERISVDRTVVVIAHRLSTVRNAHRIYVLSGGRVHEQGRHEDLVAAEGIYSTLWKVQTGEATAHGQG